MRQYYILLFFIFSSCHDAKIVPTVIAPVLTLPGITPKDSISVFKNFTFRFAIDTAQVAEGDSFTTIVPDISRTVTGIRFVPSDSSANTHFSTDDFKRINFRNTLANGVYSYDAVVSIGTKDTLFKNVFNLTVNPDFIKHLKYESNIIILDERKNYTSPKPIYFGTKPATFFLSSQPQMPSIGMNNIDGSILIDRSVLPGSYKISVSAKNSKGFTNFSDVVNVSIGGVLPTVPGFVSFNEEIVPLIATNCGRCHPGFGNYHISYNQAENLYDRINRPSGDSKKMPQNSTLTDAQIATFKKWIDTGKNP